MVHRNTDANIIGFLRILRRLGLLSSKTYLSIGSDLMVNGHSKKDKWRQANWKEYLKSG